MGHGKPCPYNHPFNSQGGREKGGRWPYLPRQKTHMGCGGGGRGLRPLAPSPNDLTLHSFSPAGPLLSRPVNQQIKED
ncbi:MAG: hypothetical protein A2Y80_08145 [Deltaproteobacteria bacterium RBG_13_58_19]|nr:MAG: hypothetical protein A2Y80_08145 [Deltaproteobacteria bacterium RBG_13_58_19]